MMPSENVMSENNSVGSKLPLADQYSRYLQVSGMLHVGNDPFVQVKEPTRDSSYPIGFVLDDRKVNAFVV